MPLFDLLTARLAATKFLRLSSPTGREERLKSGVCHSWGAALTRTARAAGAPPRMVGKKRDTEPPSAFRAPASTGPMPRTLSFEARLAAAAHDAVTLTLSPTLTLTLTPTPTPTPSPSHSPNP